MDIDKIKMLSEIFNNFAQPIATMIAAVVTAKIAIMIEKSRGSNSSPLTYFIIPHTNNYENTVYTYCFYGNIDNLE